MNRQIDFVASKETPPTSAHPDDPMVVRAASGDSRAFERLLIDIALPIFRSVANKSRSFLRTLRPALDAEDLVQTCAERLIRTFRIPVGGEPLLSVRNRAGFAAYARRLATRQIIELDRYRRAVKREGARVQAAVDPAYLVSFGSSARTVHDTVATVEMAVHVRDALRQLPASDRMIFVLRVDSDLRYAEIAARIGTNASVCRTAMARIKTKLRAALQGEQRGTATTPPSAVMTMSESPTKRPRPRTGDPNRNRRPNVP